MKLLGASLFILLSLLVETPWADAAHVPPASPMGSADFSYPARIRVRLAEAVPVAQLRGYDLKIYSQSKLALSPDRLSEWSFHCQDGRIRAVPQGGGSTLELKEPVLVQSPSGFLKFKNRPYREALEIHSVGSFCEVVNRVDLEKYLDGLVNSEFSAKWNEESIGAQVVAARTYALHQMKVARADSRVRFDVDASTRDQVYDGSMKEDFRASRAVERTRGLVLTTGTSQNPAPLKAFYHSTCGGMTELPEHVWGGPIAGFKRAVQCPYCIHSPAMNWRVEMQAPEIVRAFSQAMNEESSARPEFARGWPKGWREAIARGKLVELRAGRMDGEGRVSEVSTFWESAPGALPLELRVSGARFRDWIGPARFRSAAFQVITRPARTWQFQGRGNGHGVGMCQWGAKSMGERGHKTASILKHYYPDANLRKLW